MRLTDASFIITSALTTDASLKRRHTHHHDGIFGPEYAPTCVDENNREPIHHFLFVCCFGLGPTLLSFVVWKLTLITMMMGSSMKGMTLLAMIACAQAFTNIRLTTTTTVSTGAGYRSPLSSSRTSATPPLSMLLDASSTIEIAAAADLSLQNKDVLVFIAGVIPFAWATVEFWRRIAVGEPFGTGKDSVYIGKDNAPSESRGRQTLDQGAFTVAYILFGLAAGAIGLTLYSVISSGAPPENLL
jgi:hypothetical protein